MNQEPIFVFGTARSGTTLTYSLLLASGCFPMYEAESRILECASRYGPLTSARNRARFLADFFQSRQFLRSGLDGEEVSELARTRSGSYVDFLDGFMTSIARRQGKRRWLEKSPNNTQFAEQLASYYPRAKFVHVVRDGRSVTVSQRQLGWGAKYSRGPRGQLIWIGSAWQQQVAAGRRIARVGRERYLEIRYEDLIAQPATVIRRLGEFAGVPLDLEMVNASRVGALGGSNSAFQQVSGGISDGAIHRWQHNLNADEIALLNWHLAHPLAELGYDTGQASKGWRPRLTDRWLAGMSRAALHWKHELNLRTPLGRFARRPLEIGLT